MKNNVSPEVYIIKTYKHDQKLNNLFRINVCELNHINSLLVGQWSITYLHVLLPFLTNLTRLPCKGIRALNAIYEAAFLIVKTGSKTTKRDYVCLRSIRWCMSISEKTRHMPTCKKACFIALGETVGWTPHVGYSNCGAVPEQNQWCIHKRRNEYICYSSQTRYLSNNLQRSTGP